MAPSPHPVRRLVRLGLLALLASALPGCQSLNMGSAQLRMIDASPDVGLIDTYQNNSALAYNLGFGAITSYVPMAPGAYALAADEGRHAADTGHRQYDADRRAGSTPRSWATPRGRCSRPLLLDQLRAPAPPGEIQLRFVQQATRSGAVDVYLVPKHRRDVIVASARGLRSTSAFGANSGYLSVPGRDVCDGRWSPTGTTLVPATRSRCSAERRSSTPLARFAPWC
jgi:hypothetical protein